MKGYCKCLVSVFCTLAVVGCDAFKTAESEHEVTSLSMFPTFLPKDIVLAKKYSPSEHSLQRFQLVIVKPPIFGGKISYIKRVVGLPGEEISISNDSLLFGKLSFQQTELPAAMRGQDWIPLDFRTNTIRYKLRTNEVFVVGDNLAILNDSRSWGPIPVGSVVGVAVEFKRKLDP